RASTSQIRDEGRKGHAKRYGPGQGDLLQITQERENDPSCRPARTRPAVPLPSCQTAPVWAAPAESGITPAFRRLCAEPEQIARAIGPASSPPTPFYRNELRSQTTHGSTFVGHEVTVENS